MCFFLFQFPAVSSVLNYPNYCLLLYNCILFPCHLCTFHKCRRKKGKTCWQFIPFYFNLQIKLLAKVELELLTDITLKLLIKCSCVLHRHSWEWEDFFYLFIFWLHDVTLIVIQHVCIYCYNEVNVCVGGNKRCGISLWFNLSQLLDNVMSKVLFAQVHQ